VAAVSGDRDDLADQFEQVAREGSLEIAREWHSKSDQLLLRRGDQYEFEVFPLVQGSVPPQWVDSEQAWVFYYPHEAAIYLHFGTDPHPIEPKDPDGWLAFEWPKMEGVPFGNTGQTFDEVFADTWPTVFFKEIMHPGTPALKFVEDAWKEVSLK